MAAEEMGTRGGGHPTTPPTFPRISNHHEAQQQLSPMMSKPVGSSPSSGYNHDSRGGGGGFTTTTTTTPGSPYSRRYHLDSGGRPLSLSPSSGIRRNWLGPGDDPEYLLHHHGSDSIDSSLPQRYVEEDAVIAERKRIKDMEDREKDLSADEIRHILKQERRRMIGLVRTVAQLRATAFQCQVESEIHEEGLMNTLMRKLDMMDHHHDDSSNVNNNLGRINFNNKNEFQQQQVQTEMSSKLQDLIGRDKQKTSNSNSSNPTSLGSDDMGENHNNNNSASPGGTDGIGGNVSKQQAAPCHDTAKFVSTPLPPLNSLLQGGTGCFDDEEEEEEEVSDSDLVDLFQNHDEDEIENDR